MVKSFCAGVADASATHLSAYDWIEFDPHGPPPSVAEIDIAIGLLHGRLPKGAIDVHATIGIGIAAAMGFRNEPEAPSLIRICKGVDVRIIASPFRGRWEIRLHRQVPVQQ